MTEDARSQHSYQTTSLSWWSWRPGVRPRTALLVGSLIACVALLLITIALLSLVLGILDSVSPPLRLPGVVLSHAINGIDGQAHLLINVHNPDFPPHVSAITDKVTLQTIHDGDHIFLDYTQHLHVLVALESSAQRFPLQNGGMFSIFLGVFALLFLGLLLLPYPAVLTSWAWRDLYGRGAGGDRKRKLTGRVVALRAALQTRAGRPGLTPHLTRAWYGVALAPLDASLAQRVITFAINRAMYEALHEGDTVQITYSPHVQYVYMLEPSSE